MVLFKDVSHGRLIMFQWMAKTLKIPWAAQIGLGILKTSKRRVCSSSGTSGRKWLVQSHMDAELRTRVIETAGVSDIAHQVCHAVIALVICLVSILECRTHSRQCRES